MAGTGLSRAKKTTLTLPVGVEGSWYLAIERYAALWLKIGVHLLELVCLIINLC